MPRSHFSLLAFALCLACAIAGVHPASAAVTRTAQATIQVSAYVVSACTVRTAPIAHATATEALRATAVQCAGGTTATLQAQHLSELQNPPTVSGVSDGGAEVVVVTY
jgi:hypothetical protein